MQKLLRQILTILFYMLISCYKFFLKGPTRTLISTYSHESQYATLAWHFFFISKLKKATNPKSWERERERWGLPANGFALNDSDINKMEATWRYFKYLTQGTYHIHSPHSEQLFIYHSTLCSTQTGSICEWLEFHAHVYPITRESTLVSRVASHKPYGLLL